MRGTLFLAALHSVLVIGAKSSNPNPNPPLCTIHNSNPTLTFRGQVLGNHCEEPLKDTVLTIRIAAPPADQSNSIVDSTLCQLTTDNSGYVSFLTDLPTLGKSANNEEALPSLLFCSENTDCQPLSSDLSELVQEDGKLVVNFGWLCLGEHGVPRHRREASAYDSDKRVWAGADMDWLKRAWSNADTEWLKRSS